MSSPPGGQRVVQKRLQAQNAKERKQQSEAEKKTNESNPILKIYSDEASGLRVDPLVVLFLAVGFIFSVVALHVISKVTSKIF